MAEIITGSTPPTSYPEYYGGTIPFIKPPALSGKRIEKTSETVSELGARHTRIVPAGSVLVSCIGALGKTGITTAPSAFNQQINAIIFGPSVLPLYGFYFCQTLRVYLESVASATTISIVNKSKFSEASIPIPPLPEQERIVAEIEKQFTRLDAAIENLKHAQAALERYRRAILKAACEGRLVPTEAELARAEGRAYETAQSLLDRIFQSDVDTKSLKSIPEGWTWTRLGLISEVKSGLTKGKIRQPDDILLQTPYLRVANVQRGYLDLSDIKTIPATTREVEELRLLPGDILFTEGGDRDKLGRGWIWNGEITDCIHQNHIFRARLKSEEISPKFISWYSNTIGQRYFEQAGKQTTNLASINATVIRNLPIPIPPVNEQSRIITEVERRLSLVEALASSIEANLNRAQALRSSILRLSFSGKLVSQDPNDEPATVLLERIRETRGPANRIARDPVKRTSTTTPPELTTKPDPGKPLFVEQVPSKQIELAWEALLGRGIFGKDDAVREIAQELKKQGLAHFQRLRQDGPLFNEIASALDRGVRQGSFDRPQRGYVRAILPDPKAYSLEHWHLCLLGALDGEPVEEEDALRAAAEWARENMGLEFVRLREDGVILQGLRAALKEAAKRGEITRKRGKVFRSPTAKGRIDPA